MNLGSREHAREVALRRLALGVPFERDEAVQLATALFGARSAEILGRDRSPRAAAARHYAMYLLHAGGGWSYPRIGTVFKRDHTTVMAAVRRVEASPIFADLRAAPLRIGDLPVREVAEAGAVAMAVGDRLRDRLLPVGLPLWQEQQGK